MRSAAVAYTDQMLASLQQIIEHSVETNKEQYGSLMSKLNDTLHVVVNNRNELRGQSLMHRMYSSNHHMNTYTHITATMAVIAAMLSLWYVYFFME